MNKFARIVLALALVVAFYPVIHTHPLTDDADHGEHDASCLLTLLQKCSAPFNVDIIMLEKPAVVSQVLLAHEDPPAPANVLDYSSLRAPPIS